MSGKSVNYRNKVLKSLNSIRVLISIYFSIQFLSWPDHGVPKTASHILRFIEIVRSHQKELLKQYETDISLAGGVAEWKGHPLGPPICVHCSAGIGRTGNFIKSSIKSKKIDQI